MEKIGIVLPKKSAEIKSSPFGIGLEKLDRDLYDPSTCYDPLSELGVKWVRIQSGWAKTEKIKGVYDFSWLDTIVDNLYQRSLVPWMCLCYGNQLYSPSADNSTGAVGRPPIFSQEEKDAWSRYVEHCVAHFQGRVNYFEIWNEPDGKHCWRHGVNAVEYGNFAKDTVMAIKKVNGAAKVLAGSLFGGDLGFIYQALSTGMGDHIDFITYHDYKYDIEKGVENFTRSLRAIIELFNPNIGIIQGETGTNSRYGTRGPLCSCLWTEEKQTKFLLRRMLIDLMTDVTIASFFTTADVCENLGNDDPDRSEASYGFYGVLRESFSNHQPLGVYSPKPSYRAFQSLCALLSDDAAKIQLPVQFKSLPTSLYGSSDEDVNDPAARIYYQGFKKENGACAIVCWKATDIMKTSFESTVSMSCFNLDPNVRLIDLYNGEVYSLADQLVETRQNGEFRLLHVPIKDYPIMYTFGDFAAYKEV